jgi:glycosyltransferase involved in cell wall biosynthesis
MDQSKGFDRLIAAFPECLRKYPEATLTIVGDGPDRRPLEAQVRSLGLDQRIAMPGFDPQIRGWLRHADLFVLASRFEGLPNVLLEAIDAECPVAVLEHPGGSREVLQRVGQEHRWTDRLEQWLPEWFDRPGPGVRRQGIAHFGLETIVRQYAEVLRDVAETKRAAA